MRKNALIIGLSMMLIGIQSIACTNFLITKGASADGSTMISYAADSHLLFGELYRWPAADYSKDAMLDIYEWDTGKFLGQIKQVPHTYSVVGNMNEYQLAIGETTYGGRHELVDTTGIMDYGSLIYTTLQRAKTAREAIQIMGDLVAEYGYCSSGESFSIADPNEVWILELIGKGNGNKGAVWVAQRIPDGYISGHANQARITTFPLNDKENCIYAEDVISFAREKGYFNGEDKDFSFSDTYAPVDFGGARFCDARVWTIFNKVNKDIKSYENYALGHDLENRMPLWVKPDHKISLKEMMDFMRDHYEGTSLDMTQDVGAGPYQCPYRWRPLTWEVEGNTYCNERAVATQQTAFSFVAQCRSWLPDPIGGIFWFSVDDAATAVYTPMYCGITEVPECYAQDNGDIMVYSATSAFWTFNQVSNLAYTKYNMMYPEIRKVQNDLEDLFISMTEKADNEAKMLFEKSPEEARALLTEYSIIAGNSTDKKWKELYQYLFVKYLDGNVKTAAAPKEGYKYVNPNLEQPGYDDDYYKSIVKQTGEHFKMPSGNKH